MELFYGCLFLACILYLVYVTYRMVNLNLHFLSFFNLKNSTVEGLENEGDDSGVGSGGLGGGGANAQMYASKIKLASNRLKDKLSIASNRAAMEDLVYALDEYVGLKMVEVCTTSLVSSGDEFHKKMTELNAYNDAKTSLTTAIKIVDNTA